MLRSASPIINSDPFSGPEIARILGFMLGDNTSGLTALSHDKKRCCCGGNQSTGQQRRLLCGKPDCWLAAGFPGQQLDLQSGSGGLFAGKGFAVLPRRFLGSKNEFMSRPGGVCAEEKVVRFHS